jgi:hypothetical protein
VVFHYEHRELIVTYHEKPLVDHHQQLAALGVDVWPDFVVDDHYAVVRAFGGYWIAPPRHPFEQDKQLWRAYDAVREYLRARAADPLDAPFIARWNQRWGTGLAREDADRLLYEAVR